MSLFKRILFDLNRIKSRNYCIISTNKLPSFNNLQEAHINSLLKNHDFSDKQIVNIKNFIETNNIQLTKKILNDINNSIIFWRSNIIELDNILAKDGKTLINHEYVLGQIEPNLLFIDCDKMKERTKLVLNSGFCDGQKDVAKLFFKAPKAYFLQDWEEVILKASYIHNRVLDWILNRKRTNLYPHPIVKYPNVMEKSYEELKTRFLFAVNSGYRSTGLFDNLSKATPYEIFHQLLCTDLKTYFNEVCNGLSEEEYVVYQDMIMLQLSEEDKIFKSLSEMNDSIAED